MSYNPFQRRPKSDAAASEFAATVVSLPPSAETPPPATEPAPLGTDSGPSDLASDLGVDSVPAPVELRPTLSHIGRYALKNLLGTGGLGQVHEAWDPLLSRTVAVKTLQVDIGDPATRKPLDDLFLNEARAAAGLSHAHIVTVHDAGLSEHGVYIAMERLQGQDLRQRMAAGWMPTPGQAAQLVRRVADALSYAHARGVVHCDIKPANIFLNKHDKPKVLDFGIARVAHSAVLPSMEGVVAGSPHYLAPEQLQRGTVDARTDIHALGVVFYELLTFRRAYTGDSVEQITTAVLTNHPAPAHEVRPGVPRTLSGIAAKAMARNPADRYTSAAEMSADLRRWVDRHSGQDVTAEPAEAPHVPPPHTRPKRTRSRRKSGWAPLAAAVALGVAVVWLLAARQKTPVSVPVAALPAVQTPVPAVVETAASAAAIAAEAAASAPAPETPVVAAQQATEPAPPVLAPPPAPAPPAAARPAAAARKPAASPSAREPRPAAVAAPAVPLATGVLQLAISPWGQVEVDGQPAGTAPPLTRLTLTEGTHTVTVRNEDAPPYTITVQVQADKPVTVRHRFAQ